jgi:integrase
MGDVRRALSLLGVAITPHDLRRTYIGAATMAGVPDVAVKMLVGHAVNDVTEAYARSIRPQLPALAAQIEEALLS